MKTKQLIERALPFNQKYIYLNIVRGSVESGQFCTCDNCGTLIANMVNIVCKETNKRYTIGTDCAETLASAKCLFNNGSQSDFRLDIYSFNLTARFVTEIKKGAKATFNGIQLQLTSSKGKEMRCWKKDLEQFFPEYLTQVETGD